MTKWKKGNPYLYWVRSARVNGQPRIVEHVYLGPRDHALQRIHDLFTTGSHYLVLAALNRAIAPQSKRAFADWYATTVLSRRVGVPSNVLTSQRFWDHMQQVTLPHLQQIQQALVTQLAQQYPLARQMLIYDTTNYDTLVSTFTTRAQLPQRGRNKQRRADLRQVSVAVVLDEVSGLPVYHRCYEGNLTDVHALQPCWRS